MRALLIDGPGNGYHLALPDSACDYTLCTAEPQSKIAYLQSSDIYPTSVIKINYHQYTDTGMAMLDGSHIFKLWKQWQK